MTGSQHHVPAGQPESSYLVDGPESDDETLAIMMELSRSDQWWQSSGVNCAGSVMESVFISADKAKLSAAAADPIKMAGNSSEALVSSRMSAHETSSALYDRAAQAPFASIGRSDAPLASSVHLATDQLCLVGPMSGKTGKDTVTTSAQSCEPNECGETTAALQEDALVLNSSSSSSCAHSQRSPVRAVRPVLRFDDTQPDVPRAERSADELASSAKRRRDNTFDAGCGPCSSARSSGDAAADDAWVVKWASSVLLSYITRRYAPASVDGVPQLLENNPGHEVELLRLAIEKFVAPDESSLYVYHELLKCFLDVLGCDVYLSCAMLEKTKSAECFFEQTWALLNTHRKDILRSKPEGRDKQRAHVDARCGSDICQGDEGSATPLPFSNSLAVTEPKLREAWGFKYRQLSHPIPDAVPMARDKSGHNPHSETAVIDVAPSGLKLQPHAGVSSIWPRNVADAPAQSALGEVSEHPVLSYGDLARWIEKFE